MKNKKVHKKNSRKHSGVRSPDLILSRGASYLLTIRCLHTQCLTKRDGKEKRYTKKKNGSTPGIEPPTWYFQGVQATSQPPVVLRGCTTELVVFVRTYEQTTWHFDQKNEKSTPRRETTWAMPRALLAGSGGASKVRHVQQSAHREVDVISIYQ